MILKLNKTTNTIQLVNNRKDIKLYQTGRRGPKGEKGDSGDSGPTLWGSISGDIDEQDDLQTELEGKSNVGHGHVAADIPDFNTAVATNTSVLANTAARHIHENQSVLDATTASYTTAEKSKVAGIAPGATANDTDANLRDRSTHTGAQTAATISDFDSAVSGNDDVTANTAARHTHTNKTILDNITAAFTDEDRAKLEDIAEGATANSTDSYLLNRNNHTGTQPSSTIVDFNSTVDACIALQKAQANGIATLGSDGKIPTNQLSPLAITSTNVVSSQAAQLALTAEEGDIAVRTDESKTYIRNGGTSGTMSDWTQLLFPSGVASVNGYTGSVSLVAADLSLGSTNTVTFAGATLAGGSGDLLTLNGTGTNNTILRLSDDGVERGALYTINGATGVNLRSQANLALIANNGGTAFTAMLTGTGLGIGTSAPTHTLTLPSSSTGFVIYNTIDQTTNHERLIIDTNSNTFRIRHENGGTGLVRDILIGNTKTIRIMNGQAASGSIRFDTGLSVANTAGVQFGGAMSASSGITTVVQITPNLSQSGTAGYTALLVNATETSTGSGVKALVLAQVGSVDKFRVDNTGKVTAAGGVVQRVASITSNATPSINTDTTDQVDITALAADITSMTTNLTGTPISGQRLLISIKDNGSSRSITWGASFIGSGIAPLLSSTVAGKTHLSLFRYDAIASKWVCIAVDTAGY